MKSDDTHRGSRPPGPLAKTVDRRVLDVFQQLQNVWASLPGGQQLDFTSDPFRAAQAVRQSLGQAGHITRGHVVHALPYANWYRVQVAGLGSVRACLLGTTGLAPLGPRDTGVLPPNSIVLLYLPPGLNHGIVLGPLPPNVQDGTLSNPDWLVQGGGSGLKREQAHLFPLKGTYRGGGVLDWSANRPMDETAFMKGWISATGIAMLLDDAQAFVRVNEQCGLFLNLLDSYCRLAGVQLSIESIIHEEKARDDEGESHFFRGVAAYPWEALGLYDQGGTFTKVNDDHAVQYDTHEAKVELTEPDVQPVYRYQEYGGYLGQGHLRMVVKPARSSGLRQYQDTDADEGLFREAIGLDGSYSLISAKRVHIGKRCKIAAPKPLREPEDGKGDDAAAGNYMASGVFGGGVAAPHKIRDVQVTGDDKQMLKVAGVNDVIAYLVNWQALHPFHYHQGDYHTPQESELNNFRHVSETLPFASLAAQSYLDDPTPTPLNIDHRYGEVDYFERESFLVFHDDGSVQLGGGAGEHIAFHNGGISIEAPAGIHILPGTDLVMRAAQISVNAHGSLDLSAANGDLRLKAEKNMQLVAGNGGEGGLLLEAKSRGGSQDYEGLFGEDVRANGIVFKAAHSLIAALGQDVYLRTGGPNLGSGDIILDAGKGNNKCYLYAKEINTFTTDAVQFNYGPVDEDSNVDKVYYFGEDACLMQAELLVEEKIISYGANGGVDAKGDVYCTGSMACGGSMADKNGGMVGKVPSSFVSTLNSAFAEASSSASALDAAGTARHHAFYVQKYYQDHEAGNDGVVKAIGFSYRDPLGDPAQYQTGQLKFLEARWQQMVRLGLATGGDTAWQENPVAYQGTDTYPWPGRQKWKDDSIFLRLEALSLFDAGAGQDSDRPGAYEDPQLKAFTPVTMEAGYKLNRPAPQ